MTSTDVNSARLGILELVADFLCYLDRDGGAKNEEHFESNLMVADMLMESLGLNVTAVDKSGKITATLNIGLDLVE